MVIALLAICGKVILAEIDAPHLLSLAAAILSLGWVCRLGRRRNRTEKVSG
ncbi:hypothetical protein [Rhizobium leguminosarum]|uniref:hypothetical protein n=1 Tax=Rhizobium leguminosarum TaxID=384 RepID=UPI0035A12366